jgi:hypothetical protein
VYPAVRNTRNNRRIVGRVIFNTIRVLSKESLWVCLSIHLSLLGNNSIKTFPRKRRITGGVVSYAVRVVSKESRRLVLPRTSCIFRVIISYGKLRHVVRQKFADVSASLQLLASYSLSLVFDPEDGVSKFLRNVGELMHDYTAKIIF